MTKKITEPLILEKFAKKKNESKIFKIAKLNNIRIQAELQDVL